MNGDIDRGCSYRDLHFVMGTETTDQDACERADMNQEKSNKTATNAEFNPFDPTGMFKDMRDANLDAWAKTMVDMVNTDAYAESTGAMLDAWLARSAPFRKVIRDSMGQALAELNFPTRDDVTRLAERLTSIELRLDDLEAKLDELPRAYDGGQRHD